MLAFVSVVAIAAIALIWPVYPIVAGIRPYIFGLPFSLAWVVGWLLVVFLALVALYQSQDDSNE